MVATASQSTYDIGHQYSSPLEIYDNSQEFFREVLSSLPLHPWSVGLNFVAEGMSVFKGKNYLSRWEVTQFHDYVDRCVELGIDPFTSVKHEHKAGIFTENRENLYRSRNKDIERRLSSHSLPSDVRPHEIYLRAWGYHSTGESDELDLDFPDALRKHIEMLFDQGYHLQDAGLYLSDALDEFIWQRCIRLELNKYQRRKGGRWEQVGLHGDCGGYKPDTDVEKFLSWIQELAAPNL